MSLTGPYDLLSPQDQALAAAMASQGAPTPAAPSVYEFMPEAQIKAQRKAGDDLLAQAMSTAPIGGAGWAKGLGVLNRGLQGALGGMHQRAAVDAEKANEKARSDILTGAMGGGAIDWTALARDPSMRGVAVQGMMTDRQRKEQEARDERRFEQQNKRDDERFAFQREEAALTRAHQRDALAEQRATRMATLQAQIAARADSEPEKIKLIRAAGIDPKSPEGQQLLRESITKSGVTVNNVPGEGKPQTEIAKLVYDKELLAKQGYPADHPAVKGIEAKLAKIGSETEGFTDSQKNAASFALRMDDAEKIIGGLESGGYTPDMRDTASRAAGSVGNYAMSKQGQAYQQAERNWLASMLRKESGAQISDTEWSMFGPTFFPRPGDTPEVIKQKSAARATITEGMRGQGSDAYTRLREGVDKKQAASPPAYAPPPTFRAGPASGAKPDYKSRYGLE